MAKINLGVSILAPMAGVTGFPFRKTALKYGAEFCFTEMVSAAGYLHNDKATIELLETGKDIDKTGIQLFGNTPAILSEAALKAADEGFKVIDVNMGCPVKKVVKTGAGSAILKDIKGFSLIVESVRSALKDSIFTIKIRSGFDENSVNFSEIGIIAESSGVDAIFFHPRTRSLMFGGTADHSLTKKLKDLINIPVYASGDIFTVEDAVRIKNYTGSDGIMFARGAIGKPWIFADYNYIMAEGVPCVDNFKKNIINIEKKIDIIKELTAEACLFYGKERGYNLIKPHLYHFLKGFSGSKKLRCMVNDAKNEKDILNILNILKSEKNEYTGLN
jgi:nifR3 family TIM-barrel protein